MKVVEYWHGTIKNYRYERDVSTTVSKDPHLKNAAQPPDMILKKQQG